VPRTAPRRRFGHLRLLITLGAALVSCLSATTILPAAAAAATWTPVHPGDFPDPSILLYNGTYYGFATQNFASAADTINVQVSTSSDAVNWTSSTQDALPNLGAWAKPGNTWAPTVAYSAADGGFVMYYVATQASDGDQCIGLAIAPTATPLGPYTPASQPVVCQDGVDGDWGNYGGSIDPDIFINPQGNAFLIWKSDGNHLSPPIHTYLWSEPLSANLLTLTGSPTVLLEDDESWQSGIVEGPDMVSVGGVDYLFYSGSDEGASTYAIGYATCPLTLASACTDESTSPLLASESGMSGPGGPSVFNAPGGQAYLAFAAWQGTTVGYFNCGIRPMYMAALTFTGGVPAVSPATIGQSASPTCAVPPPPPPGYWQVASDGGIFTFGHANFYGSTGSLRLNKPVVGMAATPDGQGYWLVASDGGIFAFGDAPFYGSTGSLTLNSPIVGMVSTIDGRGYWLVAADGGIFAFGDAPFYGSLGGQHLAAPVSAMAPGYLGGGYWLVTQNGDVYPFGDAHYEGEPGDAPGGYRITGMAGSKSSNGYWLASANGNVASEGDAPPYGSMIGTNLNSPIVGMGATADGAGYWLQGGDGGIFCFGDAVFLGSMGGQRLNAPMVGIASV
jgi:hypothetical protein